MNDEERARRKHLNKKIFTWLLGGTAAIFIGMILIVKIADKVTEGDRLAESAKQQAEQVARERALRVLQMRHDSLMKNDKRYADSVRKAEIFRADSVKRKEREDSIAAVERDKIINPENHVEVDMDWRKGGFGSVALASFKIINSSLKTCKNPVLLVTFYSEDGTAISEKTHQIYLTVQPGKKSKTEEFNFGFVNTQVRRAGATLVSATWE